MITETNRWTIAVDFTKEARLRGNLRTAGNANQQDPSFEAAVNSTDKSENHIAKLKARADAFLSGGKKRSENSAEFDTLLSYYGLHIENLNLFQIKASIKYQYENSSAPRRPKIGAGLLLLLWYAQI